MEVLETHFSRWVNMADVRWSISIYARVVDSYLLLYRELYRVNGLTVTPPLAALSAPAASLWSSRTPGR